MKNLLLCVLVVSVSLTVDAQIEIPQPSPTTTIKQEVGLTDVTLEYSRPSMRGRTIFGDLVPYNVLWRTGANSNTKITFSQPVTVGGTELKAGSYAIYTKPGESSWDVYFYTDTNNWGTPQEWDDSKVAAMINVPSLEDAMTTETFTLSFDDLSNNGATLGIKWANTYVGVPFEVPTDKMVTSAIDKVMNGPGAGDYYAAAVYYYSSDKDINKSKAWMEKAMSMMKPQFWHYRQMSLIYAKAGDKNAAIDAAKKSLAGAEAAGNADYVKMNKDSLKEWGAM
ncbi:DUF2911 domain-containing protein [Gaetbulibacter aestuarii]|uniref:DUF2911 domain-containing protein n=1 Tax=Gaetbulibacter aestuarii TaxID=1502358 RepID=A0ABW7N251_9FLAO